MKSKVKYLIIGVLIITCLLFILWYSNIFSPIRINTNGVKKIIVVNNKTRMAKEITRKKDIKSICGLFNSIHVHRMKKWYSRYKMLGGEVYTFIFYYNYGLNVEIICDADICLMNNGNLYWIKKTDFKKFWQLDYEEKGYTFQGIQ